MVSLSTPVARTQIGIDLSSDLSALEPLLWRAAGFAAGFAVVVGLGWYVIVPAVERVVTARNADNPTLREALSRYVRLLVLVVALFVGLWAGGFDRLLGDSALVFAALTLALGVAGQAVIGSLVSGLALVVDPQFNVGNYISWDTGEGEVRSITLRVTRVQTPDGGLVTVPNTVLTDETVRRPFEAGRSRVVERVGVAYDDDLDTAFEILHETAGGVEDVLETPEPAVGVDDLGGDAVVLRTQFWVENPRRNKLQARETFVRRAKRGLEAAGISVSPATKRDLKGQIEVADVAPGD